MFLFIFYAETLLIPSVSSSVIAIHIPAKQPVIHRQTQKISTGESIKRKKTFPPRPKDGYSCLKNLAQKRW